MPDPIAGAWACLNRFGDWLEAKPARAYAIAAVCLITIGIIMTAFAPQ